MGTVTKVEKREPRSQKPCSGRTVAILEVKLKLDSQSLSSTLVCVSYSPSSCYIMSSPQQSQLLLRAKARRAASNNYHKLTKTLYEKLTKLCQEYDTDIYFLAYRNGRFNGFVSADKTGQPWSPPGRDTLVSPPRLERTKTELSEDKLYPPPSIKSPSDYQRARRKRVKITSYPPSQALYSTSGLSIPSVNEDYAVAKTSCKVIVGHL